MTKRYSPLIGLLLLLCFTAPLKAQDNTPPIAPSIREINIGDGFLHAFWTLSPSAEDADFAGYQIVAALDPETQNIIFAATTKDTEFIIEGLENEQTYYLAVRAYDASDNISAFSAAIAATPLPHETEPNDFTIVANQMAVGRIGYLNNNDIDYYAIECFASVEYTITTTPYIEEGEPLEATDWRVFSSNDTSTLILQATHDAEGAASDKFVPEADGVYYIRVIDGEENAVGQYVIEVSGRAADEYEDDDDAANANDLNAYLNGETAVALEGFTQFPSTDFDVFAYTAAAGTKAQFDISGNLDMEILLQDAEGNLLKKFDQAGLTETSTYYFTEAGTYYYYLIHSDNEPGGTGEYSIEFSVELPSPIYGSLLINEIATGANGGSAFIELYNTGNEAISIEGMEMRGTVAANISNADAFDIQPNSYLTIGADNTDFEGKYGYPLGLVWDGGSINNTSDTLEIWQHGGLVEVLITGLEGWPSYNDNLPYTFEKVNEAASNKKGSDWQASYFPYGTAGKRNSFASSYLRDRLEPNNSREAARALVSENYFDLSLTTQPHASSLDSMDWYLTELQPLDTFHIRIDYEKDNLPLSLQMYNTLGELVAEGIEANAGIDHNIPGLEIEYIVPEGDANEEFFIAVKALHGEGKYHMEVRASYQPIQAAWTETFNAARNGLIAPHWEAINADGNPNQWEIESALNNGDGLAAGIQYNPNGNDDWLITPVLEIGQRDEFSILTRIVTIQGTGRSYAETFQIWVGPETASLKEDFTDSLAEITIDHNSYERYAWDMAAYAGQRIRVAIRNISVNQNQQLIDEVRLQPFPDFGELAGKITDQNTGNPIEGAMVKAAGKSTLTDANGLYNLTDITVGTQKVEVLKDGYQHAYSHVVLTKDQVRNLALALLPTNLEMAYYTGLENEDPKGIVDSLSAHRWIRSSSIDFNGKTIRPGRNFMLLFGGEQGYPAGNYSGFWRNAQPIDLRSFDDAILSFKAYTHTEKDSAGLRVLIGSKHEPLASLIVNPEGEGLNQRLLSGSNNGWQWYHLDISQLAHPYFGEDVALFFEFASQARSSAGFGVAIDSISIEGNQRLVIDPPSHLTARSYENQQASLGWEASTTAAVSRYQIFRSPIATEDFTLIGQSSGTQYVDTEVENGKSYKYTVVAVTSFGESAFSNIVSTKVGAPQLVKIMYDAAAPQEYIQDFEDTDVGALPHDFEEYFQHETHFEWVVGTAETASTDEVQYEPHGRFAYVKQFDLGGERLEIIDEAEGVVLATPWFDISEYRHNLVLRFESHSDLADQHHYLAYRTGRNMAWTAFDSLGNLTDWVAYQHNLNAEATNADSLQIGFWVTHPADSKQEIAQGWAIDDLSLQDLPSATIAGKVSTAGAGTPMPAAVVRVVGSDTETYTDRFGNYRIENIDLYAGDTIAMEVLAWASNDTLVREDIGMEATTVVQDFRLSPILPRPQGLELTYQPTGAAKLEWEDSEPVGHIFHHDGEADGSHASTGNWLALPFEVPKELPFFLDSIQLDLIPTGDNATVEVYMLGKADDGTPDWSQQLYHSQMIAVDADGITTLMPNQVVVAHEFFIVAKVENANLQLDDSFGDQGFESADVGEEWVQDRFASSLGFMIDLFIDSGVEFIGEYRVYAGELPEELGLLRSTDQTSFIDENIEPGIIRNYRISALYTAGESEQSRLVTYDIDSLPWLSVDSSPIILEIPYGTERTAFSLTLGNEGLDLLRYAIDFQPNEGQNARISGSRLFSYSQPIIGDTTEVTLIIENRGQDQEAIGYALVRMPEGMSIIHSTNFEVAGTDRFLFGNGATGRELQWFNPNREGKGVIMPGERAYAKISVVTSTDFSNTPSFEYVLEGDGSGEEIHRMEETFVFRPFPIAVSDISGTLDPSSEATPAFNVEIQEFIPETHEGFLHLMSNDINQPELFIPIDFVLKPSEGTISGQVIDAESNQPLSGVTVSMGGLRETTDSQGNYSFEQVVAGEYTVYAYHPDYTESNSSLELLNGEPEASLDFSLEASLPAPSSLTAIDEQDRVQLGWALGLQGVSSFSMDGIPGEPVRYPWTGKNYDGLSEQWKYSSREAAEGESSLTLRTAQGQRNSWLFSPAMELGSNASFLFQYKTDTHEGLVDEEYVVVRLSTQAGMDTSTYRIILWEEKVSNKEWAQAEIPLSDYAGQSVQIAIQVRSRNQEAIYLDELAFENAEQAEAQRSLLYFEMHRIVNGQDATIDAQIESSARSYEDTDIDAENSYTYYLKAIYSTGTSEQSNNASIILNNLPPVIEAISDQTMEEDASLELEIIATDGNRDSIRYTLLSDTTAIRGSFEENVLILTTTANWHGEAQISVVGSDGLATDTASFMLSVIAVADAPSFTSEPITSINHSAAYEYMFAATDGDGDAIDYGIDEAPAWMDFDGLGQILSGIPAKADVGLHSVSIWATDGNDTTRQAFSVEVIDFNYPPSFTSEPITVTEEASTYTYLISAEDLDGDPLTFSAVALPSWLSLDSENSQLVGIPQHADVGSIEVAISVSDGINNAVEQRFTLTVIDVNQSPAFSSNPILEAQEGTTYIYSVSAADPDGDALSLSAEVLPSWLSFNGNTGLLTGVPKTTDVGDTVVSLLATDPNGAIGRQEFSITVIPLNDIPEFTSVPVIQANIGTGYLYAVTAFDADGDTLEFTTEDLPSWLSFEQQGIDFGVLSGLPTEADLGDHLVSVIVTDGRSSPVRQLFFIKVGVPLALVDEALSNRIVAYPNPVRDNKLRLQLPFSIKGEVKAHLMDIAGRSIREWRFQAQGEHEFRLGNLAAGQYQILLQTSLGWAVKTVVVSN